jgi:hypothetical protein
MSTTSTSSTADLLPGYYLDPSGAWLTLPWPSDLDDLPPSLAPQLFRWHLGMSTPTTPAADGPRLIHHLSGIPWEFTVSQRRFLHLWYAVRPDGRWLYRSGVKRGAKGTGKDPFGGAWCHLEARGPVEFDGFDRNGNPVGRPRRMALVQIAANSEAQAGDMLRVSNGMISADYRDECGADPGVLRTILGDARIELLTSSEASSEGDPATAIVLNESHHMKPTNGGTKVAAVARRNTAKSPGGHARILELTNAHMPGEASVAEESFEAWQAQVSGKAKRQDILYDSREAAPHLRLHVEEELELGIAQAYADSPWTDHERIRDEAQDLRTSPADSVRFYFNALPTSETAWIEPRKFDALARPTLSIADGEPVALFLDCSKSSDSTALVAARIDDGHVEAIHCWRKPHGDLGKGWMAPREEVDAFVRAQFDTFDVQWFGVDPSPARDDETEHEYWATLTDEWHRDFRDRVLIWATGTPGGTGGNAVLFDMRTSTPGGKERNRLFTEQAEITAAEIDGSDATPMLTHDGDSILRMHVHNARRRPNQWGVSLSKETRDSSKLVDMAVAMVGARLGRRLVLNSGKARKKRTGRASFL